MCGILGLDDKRAAEPPKPMHLSFTVHSEYPDKVLEADKARFIAIGDKDGLRLYSVLGLNLTQSDIEIMSRIKGKIIDTLSKRVAETQKAEIEQMAIAELQNHHTSEERGLLAMLLANDISFYGPIGILISDPSIEEIEINSPTSQIFIYHSLHGRCKTNLSFRSEDDLRRAVNQLISAADKELNSLNPIVDAQLPDGSRVHAQLKPYSVNGAVVTIRLQSRRKCDIRSLLENATVTPSVAAYLWMAIANGFNIVISGAPAAGKTSLLMALHAFVPPFDRVITIEEDSSELVAYRNMSNMVSLQGSSRNREPSIALQVKNALHMRPDRIIVGEIRGKEAKEAFAGANIGVPFMTTMHSSENGEALLNRLRAKPMEVEDYTLTMLDLSAMMKKSQNERRLDSIVEYRWLNRCEMEPQQTKPELFAMLKIVEHGTLDKSVLEKSKVIEKHAKQNLMTQNKAIAELKKMERYIQKLLDEEKGVETNRYISKYYA